MVDFFRGLVKHWLTDVAWDQVAFTLFTFFFFLPFLRCHCHHFEPYAMYHFVFWCMCYLKLSRKGCANNFFGIHMWCFRHFYRASAKKSTEDLFKRCSRLWRWYRDGFFVTLSTKPENERRVVTDRSECRYQPWSAFGSSENETMNDIECADCKYIILSKFIRDAFKRRNL